MNEFRDYHRTVVGYHGTRRDTALAIVQGERPFSPSRNDDDWLGNGVYFWEYAPKQALRWAERRYKKQKQATAVLGAMIRLGSCFDLLDPDNAKTLQREHKKMLKDLQASGITPKKNALSKKYLDCATFEYFYRTQSAEGNQIQTSRAVYVPTQSKDRLWPSSWLYQDTHIQLCVRDVSCILGVWLAKPEEL
ncbi:MAG: hypothetical protein AAGI17_10070 [Planctomycetota bacterium]